MITKQESDELEQYIQETYLDKVGLNDIDFKSTIKSQLQDTFDDAISIVRYIGEQKIHNVPTEHHERNLQELKRKFRELIQMLVL